LNEPVIQVKDFRKIYGDLVAVDGISFEVQRGEIFGLLGPNGAGKTSTLESLEGLRVPDGGSLQVMGVNPAHQSRKLRNLIGVQLQTSGLPDSINLDEAMKFFCAYHSVIPRYDLLERFGLKEKRRTQYYQLSAGQQRRLDVATRIELHNLMRELQTAGTTIILATHDMAEANEMAGRLAILLQGKIAATGTPLELTATGAGFTKVSVRTKSSSLSNPELNFPAVTRRIVKDEYIIYYSTDIGPTVSAIIAHIEAQKDTLVDLRVERPSLEDRFLEITTPGGV
jgi:ABC-2 type transport system ATP-binding protein